jgi:hypothetical protein
VNDSSTPRHDHNESQVRPGRGSWMSGPSFPEEDARLAELRARYPRWTIWIGEHTGSWWACPPPPGRTLINAADAEDLEAKLPAVVATGDVAWSRLCREQAGRHRLSRRSP